MRGGARQGAGRRPKLDDLERLAIGAECERRFNEIWIAAREESWTSKSGVDQIHSMQDEYVQAVRDWGVSSARAVEISEEIAEAIRTMKQTPEFVEDVSRVFSKTTPRPKGVKSAICGAVAEEVALDHGQAMKPSFVLGCWTEYRQFEKETRVTRAPDFADDV